MRVGHADLIVVVAHGLVTILRRVAMPFAQIVVWHAPSVVIGRVFVVPQGSLRSIWTMISTATSPLDFGLAATRRPSPNRGHDR